MTVGSMTEPEPRDENTALPLPAAEISRPPKGAYRRVAVRAVVRAQDQVERASQTVGDSRVTLRQIRKAVDPRELAGGYVGLTAGEVIGGAVGGTAGAVVAGPAGAVVGAEVGAFTAGMLGLKLGMDAVQDLREAQGDTPVLGRDGSARGVTIRYAKVLRGKAKGRVGEIVGLTSGATVGLVIAGPAGGLVGAVVGESLGGRLKETLAKVRADAEASVQPKAPADVSQWLDRFGKNTAGEAATVLVAGSVGALFGTSGLKVGQRIGRIISKRVEWDRLGQK